MIPMLAPTVASPESAGMSKAALDRVEAHLKQRYLDAGRFPGTQLLVYRRGKIVHSAVQGFADVERKAPMKDDTIFRIYSMTKPVTSVAFMMLFEEGRVALDEPVHKYIPEWKKLGVFQAGTAPAFLTKPPSRPMLIVDLLRHTSGLTYGFQQRSNVDAAYREMKIDEIGKAATLQSMIDDLAKLPLEFSPGEAWNYSVSTDVIGYLIGKISGKPFEQFLKERIFDPLDMNDTGFFVPAGEVDRFAACYSADPQGGVTLHATDRKGGLTLQDDPTRSSLPLAAIFRLRRGWVVLDRGRLSHLLPRAAQRRRARRRQADRSEDAGADDIQPSARRARPAGNVAVAI
jgi:CubicO group peptidase (beta-lactamase class C family)